MKTILGVLVGFAFGGCVGFAIADEINLRRERARPIAPRPVPTRAVNLLTCPVTAHSLAEYYRTCRAQKYSDSIKPKGRYQ